LNLNILNIDVQHFIDDNLKSDITKLILKGSPFENVSIQELANQIIAKKKSQLKLPTWFETESIYYPAKLSIEQTSSEITAKYKAYLIKGNSIIDITGGFGIDAYYFAKKITEVTHCEINTELSEIVNYNYKQLNIDNITTIVGDGIAYLKEIANKFDCIYIDPSRRDDIKGKVFLLKDCLPNVPENLDFLFSKSNTILIKNSPILDITATINELSYIKEIHIVAVQNEVKELLFLLEKGYESSITLKTINFQKKGNQIFDFIFNTAYVSEYSEPLTYLYEPNVAILKSGGFHQVASQLKVKKLQQHSHLYTSEEMIDFPGRCFKVVEVLNYDKKKLNKLLPAKKANITIRNFPKTVAQIRKETKIKDGGELYLFFTKLHNEQNCVIICKQLFI